ncbi:MAG: bifunctional glutamate N-acetyltransferase/amino-acid acetyltransferase ArgJ [Treponema sp.]|jgi:glutamate N-acetyltransferase/amino-acid N-acetyltransferase|nr:bifunctional glutamate N-acetyltransferase/amino-acid acetyltransferase ArgJ [Treponema sp.]
MKEIRGGVCAPEGFRAGGIHCGIKASAAKRDLGMIVSEGPCTAAALFTTNRVQAASVILSREYLAGGDVRAVIANSGNANACTGPEGLMAARRMTELAAGVLDLRPEQVAVASTGVIGVPLPMGAVEGGMSALAASLERSEAGHGAALEAIMTTDTRKKEGALEIELEGRSLRIGAMVKGSGMIHPNMATMLCFITTDAAIERPLLDRALRRAVGRSFNRLTVDGDTSTNDMVLVLANGMAAAPKITAGGPDYEIFAAALESLCVKLAREMARDGEGATRLITVQVKGAASEQDAAALARSVTGSSLVKAACFGADANWGRVLCALGYAGVPFDPAAVSVRFSAPGATPGVASGAVLVCERGGPVVFDEQEARRILSGEEIVISIDLQMPGAKSGAGEALAWGCDLSYDYVRINGDYRS